VAVNAGIFYSDAYFAIDLYPGEERERVEDVPPGVDLAPDSPWVFEWDAEKLDRGEREFLGLTVFGLDQLTEQDFAALQSVPLPRVSCPELGLHDMAIVDVVHWAKQNLSGRGGQMWGWPRPVDKSRRASA
jgi:hypothetical protein